jgi:aspartyl-tRNA(Asn)/glutamyl-tRNA(Gln) amidotransferase subunit B
MRAIEFEAARQVDILEEGGIINQETRLFDALQGETRTMRSKEDAMDYRYFPDPDLPPLIISEELIEQIRKTLPELPDAKKDRYISEFGLSEYDAGVLTADMEISGFFETLTKNHDPKLCVTWLTVELFGRMNKLGIGLENLKFNAEDFVMLLDLIKSGEISGKIAKDVLDDMIETGDKATEIVAKKGLKQVSDSGAIEAIIDKVIAANPDKVAEYKSGKDKLFGFFVGQVMKESGGQANPGVVNQILKEKLK